ncbi:hypothetical protein LVJ94_28715 [Pendulispora rubella]|uniref:Uncharacterized protein n=1 Tax=Pendulispora rubella TaxID=2741070 RepID=A0ABZ2KQD4_9BACT
MRDRRGLLLLLFGCNGVLGCNGGRSQTPAPVADAAVAAVVAEEARERELPESPEPGLAPLAAEGPYADLEVEGFGPAVVSLPLGATEPRPIVLATHGNYDRPEWQCEVWHAIVGESAFVLCPRGIARRDSPSARDVRFTYSNGKVLGREIAAGLAALRARFGPYVADAPIVYTGFSLGAILGASFAMAPKNATPYQRLVLTEGGHDAWTPETAKRYAGAGGKKVLFACGQAGSFPSAKKAAGHLEAAGVQTRIVGVKAAGHTYDGPVAKAVRESWKWLLD